MTAIAASPILLPERQPRSARFWIAVAVSVVLHIVVLGSWLFFGAGEASKVPPPATMEVTIADDVGLTAAAPDPVTDSAAPKSPDNGPPEDAAPPPEPVVAPPEPRPAPPVPQPKAAPPPKPAAVSKPQPAKVAPPAPTSAKTAPKVAAAPAKPVAKPGKGNGSNVTSTRTTSRQPLFDKSTVNSWGSSPTQTRVAPPGATMTGPAMADIIATIQRQIQPCARRQAPPPTPGLSKVRVVVQLSFARDGSQSAPARFLRFEGLEDERYADVIKRAALAAFNDRGCQPIKGLPAALYDVPRGWKSVPMAFRFPG